MQQNPKALQPEQELVPQTLPPEVAIETNPTPEILQTSELEELLISARASQLAKEELEKRVGAEASELTPHLDVKNLYRDDTLIFDAEASRRVFATLPTEALDAIRRNHQDRHHSTRKTTEDSNQEKLYALYDELVSKATSSNVQGLTRDLYDREDYLQEMYFVLNKIALQAPNTQKFESYLYSSVVNRLKRLSSGQANLSRVRQSWRRPLVEIDEKKGERSDRFVHKKMATLALNDATLPKVQDPTDRDSTVIMQDSPSTEDQAERASINKLLSEKNLKTFLQKIPFFTPTKVRTAAQAEFNVSVMMDTMQSYMQSDRSAGKSSAAEEDAKTGRRLMRPSRIIAIRQNVTRQNRGKNLSDTEVNALVDRNIALQIQQYRSRGRTAIQDYLVSQGYSKDESRESIDATALLSAIEEAVEKTP